MNSQQRAIEPNFRGFDMLINDSVNFPWQRDATWFKLQFHVNAVFVNIFPFPKGSNASLVIGMQQLFY